MQDLIKEAMASKQELDEIDALIDEGTPSSKDSLPEENKFKKINPGALIVWFSELSNKDISVAGGKGASLGEMYNSKFPIPPGFVITANAYSQFIKASSLSEKISPLLDNLDLNNTEKLQEISKQIRSIIEEAPLPEELEIAIKEAYEVLDVDKNQYHGATEGALSILKNGHEPPFVAVRSSATTEDLADASFAGQQDSFLNVKGEKELLNYVKKCFSSLFTARAIYYRTKKNFKHENSKLAVVVQRMVASDKSGVIFSRNPIKSDDSIVLEAVWGLGEGIVSGKIKPDNYVIHRDLENFKVLSEQITDKKIAITRDSSGKNTTVNLTEERSNRKVLSSYEIKRLAQYAVQLEEHYKKPQDIEFAIEGEDIYIVQSRPITTIVQESSDNQEIQGELLMEGIPASPGTNSGTVKIVHSMDELSKVKQGDVLVTEMTNPDMVVTMQKSAAIITNEGGMTSHAAIVSREMGIPAVVGTNDATHKLKDGQVVTVDGSSGKIYAGRGEKKIVEILPAVETKTKIKLIVDIPEAAKRAARSQLKSVGLVRLEGIIAKSGKHPLAFVKENKENDYIQVLVSGLDELSQPFEELWIRTSDLRSDEYSHLEGAPNESEGNPMLGDHGIRFSLRHPTILKSELKAVKEIADEYPQKKFGIMIPQLVSLSEFKETKRIAQEEIHLPKNVKLGIMVETPAAVQQINEFCELGIDFVSFGTNDLTQYILAIDRNNGDVQYMFDEMHPAVLSALSYVIRRCQKHGVETSICGQAGSKPEMAKFLVEQGIDSISVNADAARKVSEMVQKIEQGRSTQSTTEKTTLVSNQASLPNHPHVNQISQIKQEEPTKEQQNSHPNSSEIKEELIPRETQSVNDIEAAFLEALDEDNSNYQSSLSKENEIPSLRDSSDIPSSVQNDKEDDIMDLN